MINSLNLLLQPYLNGKSVIIHSGRDLHDLEVNNDGNISPLIEILREQAFNEHNLVLIEYSKSSGVNYDLRLLNDTERANVNKTLNNIGICTSSNDSNSNVPEFVRIMRGLLKLSQQKSNILLRNNTPLKFLVIFHFTEHLTPNLQTGHHSEDQLLSIETALKLAKSLGLRKSGNFVIFSEARQGTLEKLLYQNINTIELPQPDKYEKKKFIEALNKRYNNSKAEESLTDEIISNLSSGTPNRSLEEIYLSSEKTGNEIVSSNIFLKKQKDIVSLSEGTLESIDLERVKNQNLVGLTVKKPLAILMRLAEQFKRGDKNCLRNLMFCGSPSSGKTVMVISAAYLAGMQSFFLNSPKDSYVGESERKAKLMLNLLKQLGGFGIIDEVEMIFPLNRNMMTGDSGVTQNLQGQLQQFLSDPSLSGKVLLLATSNRPNAISEAMRQRWVIVPVLMPLENDFPEIILSIANGLNPELKIPLDNRDLIYAAKLFSNAGAAPREIREALIASQTFLDGSLNIEHILFASKDIIPSGNLNASIFADYCALSYCRSNSFLPWWDEKTNSPDKNYPYPDYIKDILTDSFHIDTNKLNKKIKEIEPYVNV